MIHLKYANHENKFPLIFLYSSYTYRDRVGIVDLEQGWLRTRVLTTYA